MNLVHNERIKLRATALNGVAIASIAAGFITPLAAVAFGVPGAAARGMLPAVGTALTFFIIGVGLHVLAIRLPGRLIELFVLGPILALTAGLIIYGLGVYGAKPKP